MNEVTRRLEEQADLLFKNVSGWESNALRRIGRRIKSIKSLSFADLQALNNATIAKQDIDAIIKELAALTNQSIPEVKRIYSEIIKNQHEDNKVLYDYRNKPFVPFSDNKPLQAIVKAYARTTADSMIKLSMTKAKHLGFVDKNGNFISLEKNFIQVIDKAVMSIATGTGDFNNEMRDVLKELGGSGLRVDYGGGVTRRLDTMVRQNLLWGAKQASVEYNEMIGEELGCDGIEIDWHSFPRPSHEFMQGKQYSLNGKKTIKGVTYESADKALTALEDYGCLHFKTPIILGVSEPRFSPEELKRLNGQNNRTFEIDGKQLTGYECKQGMRRLETEVRKTKDQINILKASGDNIGAQQLQYKVSTLEGKYQRIAQLTGIKAQPEKMSVIKTKVLDDSLSTKNTAIDFMSKSFKPLFSKNTNVTIGNINIDLKRVKNSQFELYAEIDATKRFLVLNSKYDTNKKILKFVGEKKGYFANKTQYAPYLHELGHKYYEDSIKYLAKSENISYNKSKSIIDGKISDYIHTNNERGNFIMESISGHANIHYATGKYTEIIAECFSVIHDNSVAKEIINLLRM